MWLALVALGLLCFANGAAPESDPLIFASILLGVLLVARSWLSGVELAHHRTASISDTLTGAFNQRYFGEQIARAVADARESGRGFVLLIVDVVDLSGINSRFGRDVGDRVLSRRYFRPRRPVPRP
jgi:GGDEF domain-containing protein